MPTHKDSSKSIKVITGKYNQIEGPVNKHNVDPIYFDIDLNRGEEEFNYLYVS